MMVKGIQDDVEAVLVEMAARMAEDAKMPEIARADIRGTTVYFFGADDNLVGWMPAEQFKELRSKSGEEKE